MIMIENIYLCSVSYLRTNVSFGDYNLRKGKLVNLHKGYLKGKPHVPLIFHYSSLSLNQKLSPPFSLTLGSLLPMSTTIVLKPKSKRNQHANQKSWPLWHFNHFTPLIHPLPSLKLSLSSLSLWGTELVICTLLVSMVINGKKLEAGSWQDLGCLIAITSLELMEE